MSTKDLFDDEEPTIIGKIKDHISYWVRNIFSPASNMRRVRTFYYSVKSLIAYFPIIWKDRDWDHAFFYYLIHKKLKRMENFIRTKGIHAANIKQADEIQVAIEILDRLIANEYLNEALDAHDKKWGEIEMSKSGPDNRGLYTINTKRAKAITEDDIKTEREEVRILYQYADDIREQDIGSLFKWLAKHIEGWWD